MYISPLQLALPLPHPEDLFFEKAKRDDLEKEDKRIFNTEKSDDESGEEEEERSRYPALELHAPELDA